MAYLVRFLGGPDGDSAPHSLDELPVTIEIERWLAVADDDYGPEEYEAHDPLPTGPRLVVYALSSHEPTRDGQGREVWTYMYSGAND